MIYLASPYSHPDPAVREARFHAVCREAARLTKEGYTVFSPIAHSHCICQHGLPLEWIFWWRIDAEFIKRSDEVWVLMLDGWKESTGVQAEIRLALEFEKRLRFVEPSQ